MSLKSNVLLLFIFLFLIGVSNVFAQELDDNSGQESEYVSEEPSKTSFINITSKEVEGYLKGEYNRAYTYYGEISAIGAVEFNKMVKLRGGLAVGRSVGNTDVGAFINACYSPFTNIPLNFSLSYINNWLPEYKSHTQTILPLVSFNARIAGVSLGINFRFSSYFDDPAIFESILTFFAYFNIINTSSLKIGAGAGNFNDFYAKNIGAYSLLIYSVLYLDENLSIMNDIEIMQSGGDGLTANFYGFAWRGGVKYSW